jgi:hypothetical protein
MLWCRLLSSTTLSVSQSYLHRIHWYRCVVVVFSRFEYHIVIVKDAL